MTAVATTKKRQKNPPCPVRDILDRIGDAWSVLVIINLHKDKMRFNALKRQIGDISQRMLTVTLRNLERDGIVARKVIPTTPPQVEYTLTPLGQTLIKPINGLTAWALDHQTEIHRTRTVFDKRQGTGH